MEGRVVGKGCGEGGRRTFVGAYLGMSNVSKDAGDDGGGGDR